MTAQRVRCARCRSQRYAATVLSPRRVFWHFPLQLPARTLVVVTFRLATEADISALLKLRLAIDADQARRFGDRRWSTTITEKSVTRGLKSSRVLVASCRGRTVGALRMETKKPWAIDLEYFTPVCKAV